MATTNQAFQVQGSSVVNAIKTGAMAGLLGGLVFGMMMGMMGMLPMIGMMVGLDNAVVGFVIHMLISAFIGATFGVIATRLPAGRVTAITAGAVYGVIWWVLGALIMMPLLLGMTQMVFVIGSAQWMSLVGHIVFGIVTGAGFAWLTQRS